MFEEKVQLDFTMAKLPLTCICLSKSVTFQQKVDFIKVILWWPTSFMNNFRNTIFYCHYHS